MNVYFKFDLFYTYYLSVLVTRETKTVAISHDIRKYNIVEEYNKKLWVKMSFTLHLMDRDLNQS